MKGRGLLLGCLGGRTNLASSTLSLTGVGRTILNSSPGRTSIISGELEAERVVGLVMMLTLSHGICVISRDSNKSDKTEGRTSCCLLTAADVEGVASSEGGLLTCGPSEEEELFESAMYPSVLPVRFTGR